MPVNNKVYFLKLIIFVIGMFLICSCASSLKPDEYIAWVKNEENGLIKKKQIGDYTIRCLYKPTDFILVTEKKKGDSFNKEWITKRKLELEGMQYFDLFISNATGDLIKSQSTSETDFYNKMYYYSFGFANDIKLVDGADTLVCELYHFERDYDMAKEKRFLLGFEKLKNNKEDKTLCIDSKVLGLAILKIQIKKEDILNIPELEYETKN